MTLRDLLADGERTVEEKSASRMVRAREVLLARIVDLGDRAILAGCHLRSLPSREGDEARRRLRSALGVRAAKVPAEKLRQASAGGTLFRVWQETVDAAAARPLPRLQNTDGEDLILTVDRFDVAGGKADRVLAGLLGLPDASRDEGEEDGSVTVSLVKEGNAKGVLPTTLIGRAVLEGGMLRLETNSRERADRLRGLVGDRLRGLVSGVSLAAALGALLVVERPRTRSPVAYARQLRARLVAVQADFDGALRRREGGEGEKRHASEAHPSEP